jgi:hypothetical protein
MATRLSSTVRCLIAIIAVCAVLLVAGIILLMNGCVCWFVPCDKAVHVSGHVLDENARSIENASVLFYGVTRDTCPDGCFRFGGLLAARGFALRVTKPGYKSYEDARRFAYYDVTVKLARNGTPRTSTAVWTELSENDVGSHTTCPEFECGDESRAVKPLARGE